MKRRALIFESLEWVEIVPVLDTFNRREIDVMIFWSFISLPLLLDVSSTRERISICLACSCCQNLSIYLRNCTLL